MTWVDEIDKMFEERTGKVKVDKIPCTEIPWYYRGSGVNIDYLKNLCKVYNIYSRNALKGVVDNTTITQIIGNRLTCKLRMTEFERLRQEMCISVDEVPKLIKNLMSVETSRCYEYAKSDECYRVKRYPNIAPFKRYYKNRTASYKKLEVKNAKRDTLDVATFWKRCIEVDIVKVNTSTDIEVDELNMLRLYKEILFEEEK